MFYNVNVNVHAQRRGPDPEMVGSQRKLPGGSGFVNQDLKDERAKQNKENVELFSQKSTREGLNVGKGTTGSRH